MTKEFQGLLSTAPETAEKAEDLIGWTLKNLVDDVKLGIPLGDQLTMEGLEIYCSRLLVRLGDRRKIWPELVARNATHSWNNFLESVRKDIDFLEEKGVDPNLLSELRSDLDI